MTIVFDEWIESKCLEVTQPIGTFYVGVFDSRDLVRLSRADVRRIEGEQREVETYLGIERPLNRKRVSELKEYVSTIDAAFPSAVILAIRSTDNEGNQNIKYEPEKTTLLLRNREDIAQVIDGQHRLAGLEDYEGEDTFELTATIFIDMDMDNQAMIFATINLEHTKVNKSLAYDLYDYMKARSPQKTAHNIVRLLDSREGSPFEGKIKVLGTARDPGETLSQALFIDALLPYMSKEPRRDRDLLKRGRNKPERATPAEEQSLIFRNLFLDERDSDIARVLWNYFGAVEDKWGDYWREAQRGNVLNRTTGFRGLMHFMRHAYLSLGKPGDIPTRQQFNSIFASVRLQGSDITPDNYPPGSSGHTKLRDRLLAQTGLE